MYYEALRGQLARAGVGTCRATGLAGVGSGKWWTWAYIRYRCVLSRVSSGVTMDVRAFS